MPVNDELGKRMKEYYESIPKTKLMRETPVAIRIDGKAFHTFTRGFKKPFDDVTKSDVEQMVVAMRKAGPAHNSMINCYLWGCPHGQCEPSPGW